MANSNLNDVAEHWRNFSEELRVEHRDFREQMERAERLRGEARGRFMVLGAGIVGVVIPILAGRPIVASPARLTHAAIFFLLALGISAIAEIILRLFGQRMSEAFTGSVDANFKMKLDYFLHVIDPSHEQDAEGKRRAETAEKRFSDISRHRELFRSMDDVLFYGLFLLGLWKLGRAMVF